jgi:CheY-like chemotaxis protein
MTSITRKTCLILAEDVCIGNQIASLLEAYEWPVHVVHSDKQAYDLMLQESMDVVIADIDAVKLGGLAVLVYCHHQDPSIITYAIAPVDDGYRKKLARDLGGCRGFFYLINKRLEIDTCRGVAAELATAGKWIVRSATMMPLPQLSNRIFEQGK